MLNNAKVVVIGEFNSPLSNYCNSFGGEGNGGSEVGTQENLQVENIVALVSFLTCHKSMAFKYLWKVSPIYKQHFVRVFVDGMKCFIEKTPYSG